MCTELVRADATKLAWQTSAPANMSAGKAYGERPPLVIAPHVYPELQAWLDTWRAVLNPKHDYVFTQVNGDPLTTQGLYKIFYTCAYRITGAGDEG